MKRVILILFILLSTYQSQQLDTPQLEYFINNGDFSNKGQFFYDNILDIALIIQPERESDQIKLYSDFSISKFEQLKQSMTIKNLPSRYNKFTFIPEIKQILYLPQNKTSKIQIISSISYQDNQLKRSEKQSRIYQILSIEYELITDFMVNIFICGLDNKANHQIEVWQMNQLGEIKPFEGLIKVEKNILKMFQNIYTKNNIDQQFSQKKHSLIYLSFLLENTLQTKLGREKYLNLFQDNKINILDADIFYLRKSKTQSNVTASSQYTNKTYIQEEDETILNYSNLLKKGVSKNSKRMKIEQQKLQSNISQSNSQSSEKFIPILQEKIMFEQIQMNNQVEKTLFKNNESLYEYDQVVCFVIKEDLNNDQQVRKLLQCQSRAEAQQFSLQVDTYQYLIADTQNNRIIQIQPYESGKTKVAYYDMKKLKEFQNKEIIQSQIDCIVVYNFQQEKPKILILNQNLLLIQDSLNYYYQCNLISGVVTRNRTPENWKQLLVNSDYKIFLRKNSNQTFVVFTNNQQKRFMVAEGDQRQQADIYHFGTKILNIIPMFITIGLILYIVLRLNSYQKIKRKLNAQISTFKSTSITLYQFKLRYMRKEQYMRQKHSFYFNKVAKEYQNYGYDVYVDQFNHNKAYLVKTIKIQSFQNQDYIQEYISTHLQLSRFKGVMKLIHYCIVPEQIAYVVTEIPNKTLQNQIEQQIEIYEQFDDQVIQKIAQDVISCLLQIKNQLDLAHRDIKPSSIVLAQDGQYKLTSFRPKQFHFTQNYMLILTQGSIAFMSPQVRFQIEVQMSNINYDPEEDEDEQNYEEYKNLADANIEEIIKNEDEINLYNQYKADIFSLGLTLLFATTKIGIDGLNINKDLLNSRIGKLKSNSNYSEKTKNLIEQMLKWEEDDRPTHQELLEIIEN